MPDLTTFEGQLAIIVNYKALKFPSGDEKEMTPESFADDVATYAACTLSESFGSGDILTPNKDYYWLDPDVTVYTKWGDMVADRQDKKFEVDVKSAPVVAAVPDSDTYVNVRVVVSHPKDWLWAAKLDVAASTHAKRLEEGLRQTGLHIGRIKVIDNTAWVLGEANEAMTTTDVESRLRQCEGYNGIKSSRLAGYREASAYFDTVAVPED
ncbi:MAG: hypothetical protein JSS66_05785 [Armatimonadetes bacterium]|nr:hypothetical protein [Armatimonadota bacterium]